MSRVLNQQTKQNTKVPGGSTRPFGSPIPYTHEVSSIALPARLVAKVDTGASQGE